MAVTEYLWPAAPDSGVPIPPSVTVSPFDRPIKLSAGKSLGYGLLRPFRRSASDFEAGDGAELVKSSVGQILATRCSSPVSAGELPWRTEFGSLLYTLRHRLNDEALQGIASLYVVEALERWEKRLVVRSVDIGTTSTADGGENVLTITIAYALLSADVPGNNVFLPNVEQTLQVQL